MIFFPQNQSPFPKRKVAGEREEISNRRRDFGVREEAVDGDLERRLFRVFRKVESTLGQVFDVPMGGTLKGAKTPLP